ncbi:Hairy/enhancer-of-split with YRPW motif protein 2 [Pleurotus ostreatus]|nr:Hairy/enhancer-of-split with YRPW motif protein 2 [Pleurotus ostreatus]
MPYGQGHPLEPLVEDTDPMIETYSDESDLLAEQGKNTWFALVACVVYQIPLASQSIWQDSTLAGNHPFFNQKMGMFKQSQVAILHHDTIQLDL